LPIVSACRERRNIGRRAGSAATAENRCVREELVSRLLNHKIPGETSEVYNRWRYLPEMEKALERWVYEVDRIVNKKTATVARIGRLEE